MSAKKSPVKELVEEPVKKLTGIAHQHWADPLESQIYFR